MKSNRTVSLALSTPQQKSKEAEISGKLIFVSKCDVILDRMTDVCFLLPAHQTMPEMCISNEWMDDKRVNLLDMSLGETYCYAIA